MTTIVYGKSRRSRVAERRITHERPIGVTRAKPRGRRPSALPQGQTLTLALELRAHFRAFNRYARMPFGVAHDEAIAEIDAITALCHPHGRLTFALRGDAMAVSWAANIHKAALHAAYFGVKVPGRRIFDADDPHHTFRGDGSTRRCPRASLGQAIEDLIEMTRDRFHRM